LGGVHAHLVALASEQLGGNVRRMILIDPLPPVRPYSVTMRNGIDQAVRYIAMLFSIDSELEFLQDGSQEADFGLLLAAHLSRYGFRSFTPHTVEETCYELRATTHLLDAFSRFVKQQYGPPPRAHANVLLVLASPLDRATFIVNQVGLTAEEASPAAARLYGNVSHEFAVEGAHVDVCSRCLRGHVDAFNSVL
jgi:thioesterase domain-containing protein